MAEQKELRRDAGWAELAWAGQSSSLTTGPQADLEWWSLGTPESLCQEEPSVHRQERQVQKDTLLEGCRASYPGEGKAAGLGSERTAPRWL